MPAPPPLQTGRRCDRGDAGRRLVSLIALLVERAWAKFLLDGPRSVQDLFLATRSSGFTGLNDYLYELMRYMFEIDQLDVSSLASGELRLFFQIKLATKQNFEQPDFARLDIIFGTNIENSGGDVHPAMQKRFTDHQARETGTLKHLRLFRNLAKGQKEKT